MNFLDPETFSTVVSSAPLLAVDFIITDTSFKVLLGRRLNSPACGMWCVPGGRVFKGETLKEAVVRKLEEEVGILELPEMEFIGIYEHFYEDSAISSEISTHYLTIGFKFQIKDGARIEKCNQHDNFEFMSVDDVLKREDVPETIKNYLRGSFKQYLNLKIT
jgi:colanic acid biosynthesis protein WcaH